MPGRTGGRLSRRERNLISWVLAGAAALAVVALALELAFGTDDLPAPIPPPTAVARSGSPPAVNPTAEAIRLAQGSLAAVPRTSVKALRQKQLAGEKVLIVDVRSREEFQQSHIPGAVSLPLAEVEARWRELATGAPVVFY